MAYDEGLAERVREQLTGRAEFEEKKMFGGVAYMVNTHMACGLMSEGLMVRVGKEGYDAALQRGARAMKMGERTMAGMVVIPGDELDDAALSRWVATAVEFARSELPKPPKPPRRK